MGSFVVQDSSCGLAAGKVIGQGPPRQWDRIFDGFHLLSEKTGELH
jgi:hypothetical protein